MKNYILNSWVCYKKINKKNSYHLYDGIHHQHYLVGEKEILFWETVNKTNSMAELEKITGDSQQELSISIQAFESIGLINPTKKRNFLSWNISKVQKSKITLGLEKLILILFVLGILLLINLTDNFTIHFYPLLLDTLTNLSILQLAGHCIILSLVSILLHETGHLLFAVNRNILVPSISLQLRNGLISVDTTGMQFMSATKESILIFFSGPFINFILFQYFLIGTLLTHSLFFLLGSVLNFLFFLQSMCPLFNKTDGQKILTELFKSNTFANHMKLFFYLHNRKKLTVQNKLIFDFMWIQKLILFFSLCLFIYLFPYR